MSRKTILYVGRLTGFNYHSQKNLKRLIEAAALLKGKHRLLFVGCDGPDTERYRNYAKGRGVDLTMIPPVPHGELRAIYNAADVFALVSHWEGQSKVLLEAMACGLPCVVSDIPANREVDRGMNALLFCNRLDPEDIAAGIQHVIDNPKDAAEMGRTARWIVTQFHDTGTMVDREIGLLKSAAGSRDSLAFRVARPALVALLFLLLLPVMAVLFIREVARALWEVDKV